MDRIEIDFHGIKPDAATRSKMKAVRTWWDPSKMVWAKKRCDDYGCK